MAEVQVQLAADFYDVSSQYYAVRYNLKPEGAGQDLFRIQSGLTGTLTAELSGEPGGDPCYYTGTQQDAKEVDCVLLWDEASSTYVLHRLSSFSRLSKTKAKPNLSVSTAASHSAPPPLPTPPANAPIAPAPAKASAAKSVSGKVNGLANGNGNGHTNGAARPTTGGKTLPRPPVSVPVPTTSSYTSPPLQRTASTSQLPTGARSPLLQPPRAASQSPSISSAPNAVGRMPASPRVFPPSSLKRARESDDSSADEQAQASSSSEEEEESSSDEDDYNDLAKGIEASASQNSTPTVVPDGRFAAAQNSYLANLGKKNKR